MLFDVVCLPVGVSSVLSLGFALFLVCEGEGYFKSDPGAVNGGEARPILAVIRKQSRLKN